MRPLDRNIPNCAATPALHEHHSLREHVEDIVEAFDSSQAAIYNETVAAKQEETLRGLVDWFLPEKLEKYVPPVTVTEEHVVAEASGHFGLAFGITVSEIQQRVNPVRNNEVVHVVGPNGTNLELVLTRRKIGRGHYIEVQGPGVGTTSDKPFGVRFLGLGLTSDIKADKGRSLSYTVEMKVDDRTVASLAALGGPGAAKIATDLLGSTAGQTVGAVLQRAVPVIGAIMAVRSARNAYKTFKDPEATRGDKLAALGYAVADAVFVFNPIIGTIGAVGIGLTRLAGRLKTFWAKQKAEDAAAAKNASEAECAGNDVADNPKATELR